MALTLNDRIVKSEDALFRELTTEAVLLNLKTGVYYGLNPVGTRAWQLMIEHGALAQVLDILLDEYEVDRGLLEKDLLDLGRQLHDAGLCSIAPG